jgi:hypothetical protein
MELFSEYHSSKSTLKYSEWCSANEKPNKIETPKALLIRIALCLLLLCPISPGSWVLAVEPRIKTIIDQHHPEGPGDGFVVAEAVGVMHGEVDPLVVLYQYLSQSMDRNGWQYLLVFEHGQLVFGPLLVGGGRQVFSEMKIENMVVTLVGSRSLPAEPVNDPRRPTQVHYAFMNNALVAIGR